MSLLSNDDLTRALGAIKSVTDTFATVPAIFHIQPDYTADRWGEDRTKPETNVTVPVMPVWYKDKSDTSQEEHTGAFDESEGYLVVNIEDLQAAGLANTEGVISLLAEQDEVSVQGERLTITNIKHLGYLLKAYTTARILIKRKIQEV